MISAGRCGEVRPALGVYLLGAIGPAERAMVGSHLAGCAACRGEVAELAGLPGLLGTVPTGDAARLDAEEPGQAGPGGIAADAVLRSVLQRASRLRRQLMWRRVIVAAAVAVLAAGGAAAGSRALYRPVAPSATAVVVWEGTARGSGPASGADATVRYRPQTWGSQLQVQVSGIHAGTRCQLLVVTAGGQKATAGGWVVTAGHAWAWYPASSPFPMADVRRFLVTTAGETLVSVPVRPASRRQVRGGGFPERSSGLRGLMAVAAAAHGRGAGAGFVPAAVNGMDAGYVLG